MCVLLVAPCHTARRTAQRSGYAELQEQNQTLQSQIEALRNQNIDLARELVSTR